MPQWLIIIPICERSAHDDLLENHHITTLILSLRERIRVRVGFSLPYVTAVSINGNIPVLFTNIYQSGIMDWESKALDWVADASTAQITFLGVKNGTLSNDWGIGLDNVTFDVITSSSSVPEPSTLLLLGRGLIGLVGIKRRFMAKV